MSNDNYLRILEQKSKEKQISFMNNIAERLGRKQLTEPPRHPFRGALDFWKEYQLTYEQRIQLFIENWRKVGGEAVRVSDMNEARTYIANTVRSMQARYLLRWEQPLLKMMELEKECPEIEITTWQTGRSEELLSKAAGADIGMGIVDYAVAYTGSIVTLSGANQGRSVSLLPTAFMAIIPADKIKTKLGDVISELNELNHKADLPAGVHVITGPSRSADIENDLTIGVHGPGIMYAVIVDFFFYGHDSEDLISGPKEIFHGDIPSY
jgi:L-lactate dehydrogenase complex protein LldG